MDDFWVLMLVDKTALLFLLSCLFLCFLFRNTTLRLALLIFSYPLFHLLYLKNGGVPIRILDYGDNYYYPYYTYAYWVYISSFILFIVPLYFSNLRMATNSRFYFVISKDLYLILLITFILCALMAHPWSFGFGERREQTSLSGFFNGLYVSLFIICALTKPINIQPRIAILFLLAVPFYLIVSGERVNNLLMIFVFLKFSPLVTDKLVSFTKGYKGLIVLFVCVLAALFAGNIREANFSSEYNALDLVSIFNYITAMESLHVYIASFWYIDTYGLDSSSFINFLHSFIPFSEYGGAGSPYFYEKLIKEVIPTVGGGIFLTQFIISFGIVGAFVFSLLFSFLLIILNRVNNVYTYLFYVLFITMAFRFFWYGSIYIIPSLYTLFIPIIIMSLFGLLKIKEENLA